MRDTPSNTKKSAAADSPPAISAIPYLLLPVPDTDFREYLGEAISLVVSNKQACRFITESMSLHAFIHNLGIGKLPGGSTILDNINAVTLRTRELIFDKQIEVVISGGLDDFKNLTIDSTHTEANPSWPTDSKIPVALLERANRLGQSLNSFGIHNFKASFNI